MSNDWTNKLRDQLADYQEPVSHDLWAEIEQSLAQSKKVGDEETDVKKRPQTRYVVLKRWSVAAAIALLGVGGSYVYLHDDESDGIGTEIDDGNTFHGQSLFCKQWSGAP